MSLGSLSIDRQRLLRRLDDLAQIGAIAGGGVCRLAFSDEDKAGRDQVVRWMKELKLDVQIDAIGNVIGLRQGKITSPPVMTGSHIDTVRTGGRYDGNYGVLAGLEVIETLNDANLVTQRPLAVAFFSNEEGARFAPDMMGSLVFQGDLSVADALGTVGIDGTSVRDNIERIGYQGSLVTSGKYPVHAFVELHIEQGPILDAEQVSLGAVQSVQGISWTEYCFHGVSNHAGTTPMSMRHDAGYAASALGQFVRELALQMGGDQVATVGSIELRPNLCNVVANYARVTVDLRNTDDALLEQAEARVAGFVEEVCHQEGLRIERRQLARFAPVIFDPHITTLIEATAQQQGVKARPIVSGAGHDAQILARMCPAGMIFVPSKAGISHNVKEFTEPDDLEVGANMLLHVLLQLTES